MMYFVRSVVCISFVAICFSAKAETHCSLHVRVVDQRGNEETPSVGSVIVKDGLGREAEKRYSAGGVDFCDFGITPVTVTVGRPFCAQVVVREVPLLWKETTNLKVMVDSSVCRVYHNLRVGCQLLLRVRDASGQPISGGRLVVMEPRQGQVLADSYARIVVGTTPGQVLRGAVVADGYQPQDVQIDCSQTAPEQDKGYLERFVDLAPAP